MASGDDETKKSVQSLQCCQISKFQILDSSQFKLLIDYPPLSTIIIIIIIIINHIIVITTSLCSSSSCVYINKQNSFNNDPTIDWLI